MRRAAIALAVWIALVGAPMAPVYAAQGGGQDTIVDQIGDWFSTMGKSGIEKESILAQRRASRAAQRAQRAAERQAKQAGKAMDQAGTDIQQGLQGVGN